MNSVARSTVRSHVPWRTLAVLAAACLASFVPGAPELCQYDRARIAHGEAWRLLTAHVTDAWPGLAAIDLLGFALLGAWLERRAGARVLAVTLASALAASAAVWLARPDIALYQGSSAVDAGLFAAVAWSLIREPSRTPRWIAALALALFAAKIAAELAGIGSFAVAPLAKTIEPLAVAHAAGLLAGLAVAVAAELRFPLAVASARCTRSSVA